MTDVETDRAPTADDRRSTGRQPPRRLRGCPGIPGVRDPGPGDRRLLVGGGRRQLPGQAEPRSRRTRTPTTCPARPNRPRWPTSRASFLKIETIPGFIVYQRDSGLTDADTARGQPGVHRDQGAARRRPGADDRAGVLRRQDRRLDLRAADHQAERQVAGRQSAVGQREGGHRRRQGSSTGRPDLVAGRARWPDLGAGRRLLRPGRRAARRRASWSSSSSCWWCTARRSCGSSRCSPRCWRSGMSSMVIYCWPRTTC